MVQTVPTDEDVFAFIARLDDPTQRQDSLELVALMGEVSGEEPVMWGPSIIGFGHVHQVYASGREVDSPRIAFSPRKGKFALYLTSDATRYERQLRELGKHKAGKGCIYVNRLADVEREKLRDLIEQANRDSEWLD